MPILHCNEFDLKHTLDSGQFFRYHLHEGWYYVATREKIFRLRQNGNTLEYEGASEHFVKKLFGLNTNYSVILKTLQKDRLIAQAISTYSGLRIMQQDPWECTIAFLCSQFSNIKKIRLNLERIAQNFGKEVIFKGKKFFTFPPPGAINDATKLKQCAVGFRAKYILGVNEKVSDKWFAQLRKLTYEQAKSKLTELPGIGEKVADCILLFSLGFTEAFPVDVWMERMIKENYLNNDKISLKKLAAFGREHWGKLAGYAQQYLYHWKRLHR